MIDSGFDSVDIGGYWGGWEGGWGGGWGGGWEGGGVDIGGYWGGWEGGVVVEPGWGSVPLGEGISYGGGYGGSSYGGGYGGSISSDLGFYLGRETPGLGYDDRQTLTRVCVQGGVPPKCPEGQTAVWDQNQCKWVCSGSTTVCLPSGILGPIIIGPPIAAPDLDCPEGQAPVWDALQCEWVCRPAAGARDGDGNGDGEGGKKEGPLDRVADVIERVLAGGGGGIIIPQIPQPQAVVAPTTERRYNPAAIVLLVAGLALGGYYVYQRTRRS
jgi:hypothetical protein